MSNWREYLIESCTLTFISMLLIIIGISLVTEPEYTCVNGKMYIITKDMLIGTGKECLPIDKD